VASETWISVARGLASFDGDEDAFRGWVFTIAKRRAVDHLRAQSRRPRLGSADHVASAEDEVLSGDDAAARIVSALSPHLAQIVLLRVVGGFTVDEVAEMVGRKPGTVRVLQYRALRRLAERLPDEV
jgi:RNA polymerase sigma-70 factor (ECF subfamily)